MMQQRGLNVDPSTIFRWAQRYALKSAKDVMPRRSRIQTALPFDKVAFRGQLRQFG
jgi:transposase-like protein